LGSRVHFEGRLGGGLPLGYCVNYDGSNATLRSIPITWWRGEAFTSAERYDLIVQPFKIVRHVELLGTRCDNLQLVRDVADRRYWRCQYFIFDAETRCYVSATCHDNNHVVRGRTGRERPSGSLAIFGSILRALNCQNRQDRDTDG
jgi:hypothetical protein